MQSITLSFWLLEPNGENFTFDVRYPTSRNSAIDQNESAIDRSMAIDKPYPVSNEEKSVKKVGCSLIINADTADSAISVIHQKSVPIARLCRQLAQICVRGTVLSGSCVDRG